ncbi:MAG TPA: MFS transporter [Gaiellaceae bacterium]|jgi:EmrB/QacA subfamily drug resistance transporter
MPRHSTNPWVVLVIICLAQFMVVLDATIVNVALPHIQSSLGFTEASLQWVINAYTLVFAGFLLLGGRAGDLLGRKRLFLVGLVVFTAASLLDGIASTSGELIGFRALQGLGAALISPAALSIISTTFAEGKERARALGVWAAIAIGGSAVGLVLGGALTQSLSWRWIFFVNVPVGILTFIAAMRLVPESKDEHAHQGYDLAGAVTVTGGLMALVYGLVNSASHGWSSTWTIASFVAAVVLLAAFVVIEQRAAEPLVRLSIFRVRSLLTANLAMFLAFSGMFAMFFFNSLYIQKVLGFGPLKAGVSFLPFTAGVMISAGLASGLAPRIGVRPVAAVGMVLTVIGMILFARMPVDGSYAVDVLPGMIVGSLGMGAIFMPLTLVATTGLEDEDQGLASGLFNTSQQVGGALGLAILTTIAAGHTHGASAAAQVHGFHYAFAGAGVLVALSLVVMLALLRKRHVARIEAQAEGEPALVSAA